MSDDAADRSQGAAPQTSTEPNPTDDGDSERGLDRETIVSYLQWGALFAFVLLVVIAGVGLYSSLGSIIDVWVANRYQPIARAGVNFALLCAAIGGVVATLRRL